MSLPPEVKLKGKIKQEIEDRGHMIVAMYGDGHLPVGFPDFIGILSQPEKMRGRFFGLEAKVPGKKPRPNQLAWLLHIEEAGGLSGWVDSVEETRLLFDSWEKTI